MQSIQPNYQQQLNARVPLNIARPSSGLEGMTSQLAQAQQLRMPNTVPPSVPMNNNNAVGVTNPANSVRMNVPQSVLPTRWNPNQQKELNYGR